MKYKVIYSPSIKMPSGSLVSLLHLTSKIMFVTAGERSSCGETNDLSVLNGLPSNEWDL